MAEIEIKARVKDREVLAEKLNSIAVFKLSVIKDDNYWAKDETSKKIRIRREQTEKGTEYLLTYKRKEQHASADGAVIEVNDEKETVIENPEPLEEFLKDNSFHITLNKHKEVMDWTLQLPEINHIKNLSATFELCRVPPLGDFLEIEIISPVSDEKTVQLLNEKLEELLLKSGLTLEDIEPKYYSTLLKEYNESHKS